MTAGRQAGMIRVDLNGPVKSPAARLNNKTEGEAVSILNISGNQTKGLRTVDPRGTRISIRISRVARTLLHSMLVMMAAQASGQQTVPLAAAAKSAPTKAAKLQPQAVVAGEGGGTTPTTTNYFEQGVLIRSGQTVAALGPNLMGDRVNEYSGGLEFTQTDVSLPGNSNLPVAVGRHLATGTRQAWLNSGLFGDWDLEIPRLHTIAAANGTWYGNGTIAPNLLRCSQFQTPPSASTGGNPAALAQPDKFWSGYHLYVPGSGDQTMLGRYASPGNPTSPPNTLMPTDGVQYPVVTKSHWQFSCLTSMERGAGEGFVALAPDGTRYQFDHMVSRPYKDHTSKLFIWPRNEIWILPTQVTDRFGNWVRYTYGGGDGWQLTAMTASDGRVISLTYGGSGNRIQSVSDGSRTWTYGYSGDGALQSVTQPNTSTWQFALGSLQTDPFYKGDPDCVPDGGVGNTPPRTGTITHPSGAVGTFALKLTEHGRSNVPGTQTSCGTARVSRYFANYSLVSKTLSGPGMPAMTWSYAYGLAQGSFSPCNGCVSTKTVTVTDPLNNITRNTYGTQFGVNEGLLLESAEGLSNAGALRLTSHVYQASNAGPYPSLVGYSASISDSMSRVFTPQSQRTITQQGVSFVQTVTGFDSFARPVGLTRSSSLGYSRSESTGYYDHLSLWVLGQVASQTIAGLPASGASFSSSTATVNATYKFGQLVANYAFNPDGTLYSVTDALGHATTYSQYKRGLAQRIGYADGSAMLGAVNDLGLLTSVSNEAGTSWTYSYDVMGRLAAETPPGGDAMAYNTKTFSFVQVPTPEYGLEANHWRQTITQGNAVTVNYFDARWRKRLTTTYDVANPAATQRTQLFHYDPYNRTVFASYPARSISGISAAPAGTTTVFDALGRPVQSRADSELGPLVTTTQYLAGFQKQVINPRGIASTTAFQVFDEPSESDAAAIWAPAGVSISINRDAFGKPLQIARSGGDGTSATRSYVYDAYQRLCKTIEPESGATVQYHDTVGNLQWRASGLALPSTAACDHGSVPAARMISHGYDARNRLTSTAFGDGSPGIGRSYTADGLPLQVWSSGQTWGYAYNNRRLLVGEALAYPGGAGSVGWGINANGHVTSMAYPDGSTLNYEPNALGQATRVGPYASGISYHPNGAVAGYTLANGVSHTVDLNARGLPELWRDAGPAGLVAQDRYAYDPNGNVTGIADEQGGGAGRSMGYDPLDRLTSANGVWGAAAYGYDALDNLRSSTVGGRVLSHNIDSSTNRLASLTGSQNLALAYDANGNVIQRGGQGFGFDIGNRLASATGVASYTYDGHGRRSLVVYSTGQTVRHLYSQAGQLLRSVHSSQGATQYVYLGDKLIAETNSLTGTSFTHTDALGSPVAKTNNGGQVLTRTRYEPYGTTAAGTVPNGPGFTGHVNDPDTGLVYMQQRYYDPIAGRFLSVDPITTNTKTGDFFNRYAYGNNNPLKYRDPDGRASCVDEQCTVSTIDRFVPRQDGRITLITFVNDNPAGSSPNQPISTATARLVESIISKSNVDSVNINSTTGGHSPPSNHAAARAVDINRVEGKPVNTENKGAARIQENAKTETRIRENFGPKVMEKTLTPGGAATRVTDPMLTSAHQDHVHISSQP